MGALWHDAVRVAAAKLATWDQSKAAAAIALRGKPCPFAANDLAAADLDGLDAAARIPLS
jgi:hypothetical protein